MCLSSLLLTLVEISPVPHRFESREDNDVFSVSSRGERARECDLPFPKDASAAAGGGPDFPGSRQFLQVHLMSNPYLKPADGEKGPDSLPLRFQCHHPDSGN